MTINHYCSHIDHDGNVINLQH